MTTASTVGQKLGESYPDCIGTARGELVEPTHAEPRFLYPLAPHKSLWAALHTGTI